MHIELVSSLTTAEFIKSSRRGKPKIVYSDNAKTLKAGVKWLANINRDQKIRDFLSNETILWKFNVPKAPWWGGQFERLIGLIKASLYRTIGKAQLTWAELEEVLLDIEIILNNRPLTYIEEEIDYPILTPNSLILGPDVNFLMQYLMKVKVKLLRGDISISHDVKKLYGKDGNRSIW